MSNKLIVTALTAAVMTLCSALAAGAATATVKKYELKVNDFTYLDVEDGYNVDYRCSEDSAGMAVFETTKEIADAIIFENRKGKLTIQKPFHGEGELSIGLPTIRVYSRFLKQVENCGDSTVRVLAMRPTMEVKAFVIGNGRLVVRNVECSKFDGAIKTGNGSLVVSGNCETAVLSNTGTGAIQADNLKAKEVSARFFGTGTTGVWATDLLKIKGVMAGKLYFRDRPKKIKNYSMGVKVFTLEGMEWKETPEERQANTPAKE